MKSTSRSSKPRTGALRAEYQLDYAQSRGNRFAARLTGPTLAVVLEPDVAQVFDSSKSVNRVLRSVIAAVPRGPSSQRTTRREAG